MARIKTSGLITDIRGKVGGSIFQGFKGGISIRSSITPINKLSQIQLRTRQITSELQDAWRDLTAVQRQLWELYTQNILVHQKHNNQKSISGHQFFLKCNHYRVQYGLTPFNEPNIGQAILENATYTIYRTSNKIFIKANRNFTPADEFIVFYITQPLNNSIHNRDSILKLIKLTTTLNDTFDITSYYLELFGSLPNVGDWVLIKSAVASNISGLLTNWNRQQIQISAGGGIDYMQIENDFEVALSTDFTFGNTNAGSSMALNMSNNILLIPCISFFAGDIKKYSVYLKETLGIAGRVFRCALYDTSFVLIPNSESEEKTVPVVASWVELNCPVYPALSAVTYYYFALWGNGTFTEPYSDIGIVNTYYKAATYASNFPNKILSPSLFGGKFATATFGSGLIL